MGNNAGRSGRRWRKLQHQARIYNDRCWRCGQPLDRTIPYRDQHGNVNPDYVSAEHKLPRSKHLNLAEDPGNLGASHLLCNLQAGDRDDLPTLGMRSQDWDTPTPGVGAVKSLQPAARSSDPAVDRLPPASESREGGAP